MTLGVLNSPVIEVGIGLALVYLVLSLMCSAIVEGASQLFNLRAETMWSTIKQALMDPEGNGLAREVYNHGLFRSLAVEDNDASIVDPNVRPKPSYVPADLFSLVLVEVLMGKPAANPLPADKAFAKLLKGSRGTSAIAPLVQAAEGDVDQARKNIEVWFDSTMERASGWYKRRAHVILVFVGFLLAFVTNADTVSMTQRLWSDPTARARLVQAAETAVRAYDEKGTALVVEKKDSVPVVAASGANPIDESQIPPGADLRAGKAEVAAFLGWKGPWRLDDPFYDRSEPQRYPINLQEWAAKLAGIVMTTFALSLGAPFWFDILKKLVNVRASGTSPTDPKDKKAPAKERIKTEGGSDGAQKADPQAKS